MPKDKTPPALLLPGFGLEEDLPSSVTVSFRDEGPLDYADRDRRRANPTRHEARQTNRAAFDGPAYVGEFDYDRLSRQLKAVYLVMRDGGWYTIREVTEIVQSAVGGGSETGIAAAMRALRQPRNGGHRVERQRRGDPKRGIWEYRIKL